MSKIVPIYLNAKTSGWISPRTLEYLEHHEPSSDEGERKLIKHLKEEISKGKIKSFHGEWKIKDSI